jgi:hypothetical protein
VQLSFKGTRSLVAAIFADRLLQVLILGTVVAAFFFDVILEADPMIVIGVLVTGIAAALQV